MRKISFFNNLFFIAYFLISFLFMASTSYAQIEEESYKEELSYGQKDHFFLKKKLSSGLSEVTQSRQEQPWRQSTWTERVNYFISQLRKGDTDVFLYVDYALLDGYGNPYTHKSVSGYPTEVNSHHSKGVLWVLLDEAVRRNVMVKEVLTQGSAKIRKNIIKATLKGLLNKDPRVRLVAINLLRRLGPDVMMYKAVKNAMILETVTTERSKLRPKDMDIPSIESPRLGYDALANKNENVYSISDRFKGYSPNITKAEYLNSAGKGLYLTEGLYKKNERNDYEVDFYRYDHRKHTYQVRKVWTKAPLLRYGADQKISGYELRYGLKEKESIQKFVYAYLDYQNPYTRQIKDNIYYAYHSVWEELNKLYLFINRVLWASRIKSGDVDLLARLSKDSFRSIADQIDGESLENVPMKSPSFKIFSEDHIQSIIVGLLNNKVVSTREECLLFLKRIYVVKNLTSKMKSNIKMAIRAARRRALITDIERGRHLQSELLLFKPPKLVPVSSSSPSSSNSNSNVEKATGTSSQESDDLEVNIIDDKGQVLKN